jgi:RNA polymerase sigma-70 factor (ECF subfamily)
LHPHGPMTILNEVERARLEDDVQALCERGDLEGAATLTLRGLGGEILGFLRAVHRDETVADDVFSAFAEGLWRSLPGFAWSSTLRTWAYAIARNASRMERRGTGRRERRGVRLESSALENVAAAVRTETLTFLRTDKRSRLEALREALSPEDRELLVLRVDRGLAWNDLARVLAEEGALDEAEVAREAARLRKRFQLLKERLRVMARGPGVGE